MTSSPPPPPPDEPVDPTVPGAAAGRRTVVDEGAPAPVVRPYPWWLWLLAGLFLALAILFLVLWLLERNNNATKSVPFLLGLNRVQAQNKAARRGFTLKVVHRTAGGPPGKVLDQAPQSGANLERGSQIMAVLSAGRAQVTVPKLVGSTAAAAQQLLTAQGLQSTTKVVASAKARGLVVAQDPTSGAKLAKGSIVTVSVSSGKGAVKVPAVQGTTQAAAVAAITNAGLVPVVIQVPSQKAQGTVIAQDPAPNQQVRAQSKVRLNVSGGPASTQTLTVTTSQTTTRATTVTTVATTTTP